MKLEQLEDYHKILLVIYTMKLIILTNIRKPFADDSSGNIIDTPA